MEKYSNFSIGEISKLFGISEPTLRYYDKIGLFKPVNVNNDTGYRYYTTEQFELLNCIKYLKFMGIPLKEMKNHLNNRNEEYFLQLLIKCKETTERRLNNLAITQNRICQRIEELKNMLNIREIGVARIEKLPARNILCIKGQIWNCSELEITLKRLEKTTNLQSTLFISRVGLSIAQKDLEKRDFTKYCSISIFPEEVVDSEQCLTTLPAGKYACIYCRKTLFESKEYYEKLLDYIEAQGYIIAGDSVQREIINQFITKDRQKYLSEIQIPIKRRSNNLNKKTAHS